MIMQKSITKTQPRNSFLHNLNKILDVQKSDADAQRRSKILNVMLFGVLVLIIIAFFVITFMLIMGLMSRSDTDIFYSALSVSAGIIAISYLINRRYSEELAASIFLLFLSTLFYLTDTPYESIWGQNMIVMALPVIMASVILRPTSSFIVATALNIFFIIVSATQSFSANYVGMLAYYSIAFVAWLSASTLENALKDLRILNQELDVRVVNRTKELQIANSELRQARDKAIEASVFKSQLTAKASHELRTPLGSIIGFSEMLRGGHFGAVNENQKKRLTKIIDITNHLTKLINNWLDQAQLESGRLKLNIHPFSVRQLSESVADTMLVLTQEKELNFSCRVEKEFPPVIFGDEDRLHQILVNLIGNAIKYTDKGSIHSQIYLPDENHWAIAIKDSGCGISVDALPFIFESFHQVDGTRTRKHEGFGLGLSIVKQLVDLMEGEIYVDSQVNKGSTFTVVLPLMPVSEKQIG
ncbi:MAG: hypothetical protein DWQ04_25605 [Chloroflexi bacterium]|nr:MAG: hypothetical protein DWQ04_25605 [Chloroflexota bacterium]